MNRLINIFLLSYNISLPLSLSLAVSPINTCQVYDFSTHWLGIVLHELRLWVLIPSLISLTSRVDKRSQPLSPGITLDIALCALQMKSYRRPFGKKEHDG